MGNKLVAFFAEAERAGGMLGKLKLAGMTKMTSGQANSIEDTPELLKTFTEALAMVKKDSQQPKKEEPEVQQVTGDPKLLRRHIQLYLDMMTQRSLILGDVAETVRRVDEAAAEALDCARVSVWFLDPQATKISCLDLYERTKRSHTSGVELFAKDFPAYFKALKIERTIAAHDAHKDPRTSCFSEPYLKPLGINSMLDVPIWADGTMVGVVCHEHVGPARTWNADEEKFAYLMSSFVALAKERRKLPRSPASA